MTATTATQTTINKLRGVPLFYERFDDKKPRPHTFPVARAFVPKLEAIVAEVQRRVPDSYGEITRITSGGMAVSKQGKHGEGHACDFDRVRFEHVEIAPKDGDHAASSVARRRRYWSLVAICRSFCCFTLHGEYDDAHKDHIHVDDSVDVVFAEAHSTVTLLQSLLNVVHGASPRLRVDGDNGPKTRAATAKALTAVGLSGSVTDRDVWIRFLRRSAERGFELAPVS